MTVPLLLLLLVAFPSWVRCVQRNDRTTFGEALLFAVSTGCALGLAASVVT